MSAKELTQEIERETNATVVSEQTPTGVTFGHNLGRGEARQIGQMAAGAEGYVVNNTQTDIENVHTARERAQQMGWQVIDSGRGPVETVDNPEATLNRIENEVERPLEFVGDESQFQVTQREQDDLEDLKDEEGRGELRFVDKIVAANQEAIAQVVAPEVNKIINQKNFRIVDLENVYRQGVNKTLGVFNRRIGDRN